MNVNKHKQWELQETCLFNDIQQSVWNHVRNSFLYVDKFNLTINVQITVSKHSVVYKFRVNGCVLDRNMFSGNFDSFRWILLFYFLKSCLSFLLFNNVYHYVKLAVIFLQNIFLSFWVFIDPHDVSSRPVWLCCNIIDLFVL